jgi:hypothetical protein
MNGTTLPGKFALGVLILLFVASACQRETGFRPLPEQMALIVPAPPTVQADSVVVTDLPANFFGTLTSPGTESLTRFGFCFSTTVKTPTIADSIVESSAVVEDFPYTYKLSTSHLLADTLYYLRAFAESNEGIAYGATTITFKIPDNRTIPTLTVEDAENITNSGAHIKANISVDGGSLVTAYGICVSNRNTKPDLNDEVIISGQSPSEIPFSFAETLSDLNSNSKYIYRAFASNAIGTAYSDAKTFTTSAVATAKPTVQTNNVLNVTSNSASLSATVEAKGTSNLTKFGFCYSTTNTTPTTNDIVVEVGTQSPAEYPHAFTKNLTGLAEKTEYHVRAFATNSVGTSYGVTKTFKTTTAVTTLPTVATKEIPSASITTTQAKAIGTLTSQGTASVSKYGFCYSSTNTSPTVSDNVLSAGTTAPTTLPVDFSSDLSQLQPATQYYLRAFATSSVGTSYGTVLQFKTAQPVTASPTVQTVSVSSISYFSASVFGNITSKGTAPVTEYGVVYSTSNANPVTTDTKVITGTSSPSSVPFAYTSSLTGLTHNTAYYVRAYAINSVGTSYGTTKQFKTAIATPVVTTDQAVFSEPMNTTTVKGTIQSEGASTLSRYGFCYSSMWLDQPPHFLMLIQPNLQGFHPELTISGHTPRTPLVWLTET